jgi:hypothetical protein
MVIALPVAVPIAIVLYMWDRRRMQVVAERTGCECCGAPLAVASLRRADTEWAKHTTALRYARVMMRRMIRRVWAKCATCGAEYGYDTRAHAFHRVARNGLLDDQSEVSAS